MKQNKRFAVWLAEARHGAGLTQAKLAEYLDVAQATVSYWEEEGRLSMEPEEIRNLAQILRVEPVVVADMLGYPTRSVRQAAAPISQHDLADAAANLSLRLATQVEDWVAETFAVEFETPEHAQHSG